ncbi:phosphoglycerol transferase MdoB-like AlkP superfamily enzyme [Paenibacillus forsythiae]|uniref:Phosphoglycerol transferase MdoB-like AlkP superfamily enzyme n=1 Tax=Paenibacillus forsythiae TaxID=365616 RepID=A0ABU3H2P1_9BACL|nr:LTA synthase family protein [Paenibacillus forsythiae]MDT3425089.1 phosphoglycerol transferase MdoB-like AlkP superfamily enzyme [Paenibacillus forsythiae]
MKKPFYIIPSILFIVLFAYGRILLYRQKDIDVQFNALYAPTLKDIGIGLFILLVLYALSRVNLMASYLAALALGIFHLANVEYIYALDHVVNLKDITMASDKEFIAGTLFHVSFPVYSILLMASLLASVFGLRRLSPVPLNRRRYSLLAFAGLSILYLAIAIHSSGDWKNGNFVSASIRNSAALLTFNAEALTDYPPDIERQINTSQRLKDGEYLLNRHTGGKNILMVVMEGIPGAYSPANQEFLGISNEIQMTSLDKIKDHSLILPNYITHNNQTIRGMYSLVSGDYPKLDASTPKAYEYLQQDPRYREELLPKLLKNRGYSTAFIQAAELEYMSKGDFMTAAGFDTVIGGESFKNPYVPFGWGPDDKAFFEQSQKYIDELNAKGKPWFATMLTVGTHHPYAVTDDYAKNYPSRKAAAVAYLNEALSGFIDYIDHSSFAKDTLVLFVSDESHGVNDQPYGSNWGIFAAYSPDIDGQIIGDGVYGQKDILLSLLDYADPGLADYTTGRSVFRKYTGDSPVLFASHYNGDVFYSTEKGTVYQVDNSGQLYSLTSENGELFSGKYERTSLSDDELKKKILTYKNYIDKSSAGDRVIVIMKDKVIPLIGGGETVVTAGQFITLPEESYVDIQVDYDASSMAAADWLVLKFEDYSGHKSVRMIDKPNSSGRMTFRFHNKKTVYGYAFNLKTSFHTNDYSGAEKALKISKISVEFSKTAPEASPSPAASPRSSPGTAPGASFGAAISPSPAAGSGPKHVEVIDMDAGNE